MRKQNRSCGAIAAAKQKFNFGAKLHQNSGIKDNKRGYSAEGYSLLTSALRPRLFGVGVLIGVIAVVGTSLGVCGNTSAVSATLSIPDSVSVNVNPTIDNGFAESSNGAISVSTGNLNGYTLAIKAKDSTNGNALVNTSNSNARLNSISTTLTADQYKEGGNYTNTWGFRPSEINNSPNTSYVPGPNSTTGITLASTHINNTEAENYSIGIAAKINNDTIAGNYTNTFTISATANEARYTIKYDASSLSGATNASSFPTESNIITGDTQVINSTEPTKSGTDFLGWCDEPLQSDGTCKGSVIQAGGNLRMCKCNTEVTLYAMWGTKPEVKPKDGADCTHSGYSGAAKSYGGYCWMWEDLNTKMYDGNYVFYYPEAETACPSGWHLPSYAEFNALLTATDYGTEPNLYNEGWKSAYKLYWSSTRYSDGAYHLKVDTTSANIELASSSDLMFAHEAVRCVAD